MELPRGEADVIMTLLGSLSEIAAADRERLDRIPISSTTKDRMLSFFGGSSPVPADPSVRGLVGPNANERAMSAGPVEAHMQRNAHVNLNANQRVMSARSSEAQIQHVMYDNMRANQWVVSASPGEAHPWRADLEVPKYTHANLSASLSCSDDLTMAQHPRPPSSLPNATLAIAQERSSPFVSGQVNHSDPVMMDPWAGSIEMVNCQTGQMSLPNQGYSNAGDLGYHNLTGLQQYTQCGTQPQVSHLSSLSQPNQFGAAKRYLNIGEYGYQQENSYQGLSNQYGVALQSQYSAEPVPEHQSQAIPMAYRRDQNSVSSAAYRHNPQRFI